MGGARAVVARPFPGGAGLSKPLVLCAVLALSACGEGGGTGDADGLANAGALGFRIAPPRQLRAIDRGDSVPQLQVNGNVVSLSARDAGGGTLPAGVRFDDPRVDALGTTRSYPRGSRVDIVLDWEIDGMPVWRAQRTVLIDGNTTVTISADEYRTDVLDTDGDGHSNFDELTAGSDPDEASSTPVADGLAAEFAGEWRGLILTQPSENEWLSHQDLGTFIEAFDEAVDDPDRAVDVYALRIDASGALTSFDWRADSFATAGGLGQEVEECFVRYDGTISTVSEDRYVLDAGSVFRYGSQPVIVERRPGEPDTLWISDDGDFWLFLQPYEDSTPLDASTTC